MHGAGRTDAGVHALGQVGSCRPAQGLGRRYRARSPQRASAPHPVAMLGRAGGSSFDARFSARSAPLSLPHRQSPRRPHARARPRLAVPKPLDSAAMHAAAQRLVGRHDFTTFRRRVSGEIPGEDARPARRDARRGRRPGRAPRRARSCTPRCARWSARWSLVGEGKWSADDLAAALAARPPRLRHGGAAGRALSGEGRLRMTAQGLSEISIEDLPIDRRQRGEIGRPAVRSSTWCMVCADQAELEHRAIVLDEAGVRGAAGGRELRLRRSPPAPTTSRGTARPRSRTRPRSTAPSRCASARARGRRRRRALDQGLERGLAVAIVETDVEARPRLAGNEVDHGVADVDRGEFEVRCDRNARCHGRAAPPSARSSA